MTGRVYDPLAGRFMFEFSAPGVRHPERFRGKEAALGGAE
jgi:hypothetical protein